MAYFCAFGDDEQIKANAGHKVDKNGSPFIPVTVHQKGYLFYSMTPVEVPYGSCVRMRKYIGWSGAGDLREMTEEEVGEYLHTKTLKKRAKTQETPAKVKIVLPPRSIMEKMNIQMLRDTGSHIPNFAVEPGWNKTELIDNIITAAG